MNPKPVVSIVDDDESVREATVSLVRAAGFDCEAFSGAAEFIRSPEAQRTACLIMDAQMPEMSGPELYTYLLQSGHPIPTILITAYPNERARKRLLEAGLVGYLTKPFKDDELLDFLQLALAHRDTRRNDS